MSQEINKTKRRGRPPSDKQIDVEAILEIAIHEFANKGFEGTKQRDIAQMAGLTKLNYHFDNKEDLWRQAVLQLGDKLKKRIQETQGYFKDLKGLAALKAFTRQFIYFSAAHPEFYKIIFHEMCTQTERATWLVDNILSPVHAIFDRDNSTEEDGTLTFEGVPIANLSSIIIGAANTFFIHSFQVEQMYGVKTFDEDQIEKHADIVMEMLFARFEK